MKRIILILLAGLISAADPLPFEDFIVGFWPEYDHPGVLVTMEMVSSPDQLPVDFNVILPMDARMALKTEDQPDGTKSLVSQEIIVRGDQNLMPIHVDQTQFYTQFYYNPFDSTTTRQFSFPISFDRDLDHFGVIVQQHMAGKDFKTNLENAEIFQDEFNFTYHRIHEHDLKAGDVFTVEFSYQNPDRSTSVDILRGIMERHPDMTGQMEDGSSGSQQPGAAPADPTRIKYIVFLVILVLVIGGSYIVFQKKPTESGTKPVPVKRFCTACGKEIENNRKFCTNCGKDVHAS